MNEEEKKIYHAWMHQYLLDLGFQYRPGFAGEMFGDYPVLLYYWGELSVRDANMIITK